jgi:hypothetical protein
MTGLDSDIAFVFLIETRDVRMHFPEASEQINGNNKQMITVYKLVSSASAEGFYSVTTCSCIAVLHVRLIKCHCYQRLRNVHYVPVSYR